LFPSLIWHGNQLSWPLTASFFISRRGATGGIIVALQTLNLSCRFHPLRQKQRVFLACRRKAAQGGLSAVPSGSNSNSRDPPVIDALMQPFQFSISCKNAFLEFVFFSSRAPTALLSCFLVAQRLGLDGECG